MNKIFSKKNELREEIKRRKKSCSLKWKIEQSNSIFKVIEQTTIFQQAKIILIYHALSDEVLTQQFIKRWSSKKEFLLPVVIGDKLKLKSYEKNKPLQIGAYGISEPTGDFFLNYSLIDLAIIPGVAFDYENNRLGRGKGYYDKLLPLLNAPKIGVCYSFQYIREIPYNQFDIKMDKVIFSKN